MTSRGGDRREEAPIVIGWVPNDEYDFTVELEPVFDVARDLMLDQPYGFDKTGRLVTLRQIADERIRIDTIVSTGQVLKMRVHG